MLILHGKVTPQSFRIDKLLDALSHIAPNITHLEVQPLYFLRSEIPLTEPQKVCLQQLTQADIGEPAQSAPYQWIVTPRLGTLSPWSSKATDILHNCGLECVQRIEWGMAYRLQSRELITKPLQAALQTRLHDPMTETILTHPQQAEQLFIDATPEPLQTVPVLQEGLAAIEHANSTMGLSLNTDEMTYLVTAFTELKRDPSDAELMMFAQANSEHCRHKIFNAQWRINGESKADSLFSMIRHTHRCHNERVLSAYKDNAAVLQGSKAQRFFPCPQTDHYQHHDEDIAIVLKVETHNHPTAVAPFPGAATGAGGEIRDEGATGCGAKPKAGLTGFSVSNLHIPDFPQPWETPAHRPAHIASALDIMIEGPLGSSAFNNEFGRPNLCGYFRSYEQHTQTGAIRGYHKPIMLAGGMGNIRTGHIEKQEVPVGALLIVLGGPAMQIGLGGGAASSGDSRDDNQALDFASVQRGNPEMERRCQEVIDQCWHRGENNPILFIHDVGAGGLSNALPELVHDSGRGGQFQLRDILLDEPGMSPLAIWSNESQERYVLAIAPASADEFRAICQRERCPFAIVGKATQDKHLLVNDTHFDQPPVDMPLATLLGKLPTMQRDVQRTQDAQDAFITQDIDLSEAVERVLKLPCVASKGFLITIGDRSITGMVCRDQMVGPWQVPVSDYAMTCSGPTAYTGEVMTMGERAPLALINAPASGRMAVAEAITNMAAAPVGALTNLSLSANWMAACGHEGEDAKLYDAVHAVAMELCPALGIPIPVGKDSLSMQTRWQDQDTQYQVTAPLSLVISAVAPVTDVRLAVTPQLRTSCGTSCLVLVDLGLGQQRMGGSALAQVYGKIGQTAPDLENPDHLKGFFQVVQQLLAQRQLLAYHDRSDGGLWVTLCEMAFAGHTGIDIHLDTLTQDPRRIIQALLNEELGAVLQIREQDWSEVQQRFADVGLQEHCHRLGSLNLSDHINLHYRQESVLSSSRIMLQRWWSATSHHMQLLRDNPTVVTQEFDNILDANDPGIQVRPSFDSQIDISTPFVHCARPSVAILREQGINGHNEMAAAFDRAGFDAIDVHMSDILQGRRSLDGFQGLAACGGFSYGDVLGAGRGWASSILLNPKARSEFERFFQRNDTFTLGVCNGCQVLAHLVELIPGTNIWPQFTQNQSGQFEARVCMVEVAPSPSIMFAGMQGSRIPVAVAHQEGYAQFSSPEAAQQAEQKQLVSLRYIDNYSNISERYPFNPNGSAQGVTGLTSEDGRVTLMMPHPERVYRSVQNSWFPNKQLEDGPWLRLFRNARVWVG